MAQDGQDDLADVDRTSASHAPTMPSLSN
jgi:hypothetical protein